MSDSDSDSEGSSTDLNLASSSFKPLRVLYSRKAQTPVPEAKVHDNVQQFESQFKLLGGFGEVYSEERVKDIRAASSTRKAIPVLAKGEQPMRRFLPHQGLVDKPRRARFQKNIFTRLGNMEGPLSKMLTWMRERVRVKVYTRKEKGIRGYATGYVEIFDKHWNMALTDVFESWKRRKYSYSQNNVCALGEPQDCSDMLRKMGISVPEVSVKSVNRKYVICTRKVPKMLIRGEQVVLVTPDKVVDAEGGEPPKS
ncbi:U7 snRNA-associated Sm-like protein LSm11 [Topomyia yanbarensis]|uniref:U7 snRNA-associated Sm-like protein LSm11 n=1 Tax=Topomyia yanbarensis TaxID=2498891 RepID=UPI00273CBE18|nr:U7 snRNA-associated Sm-like protein LSm11 [Topomyia yanbarensis]